MKSTYDFEENNKKYNLETFFNLDIILSKTCYFKGEIIKGKIKIIPKDIVKKSFMQSSIIGNVVLEENYNYKYGKNNINEEVILFKYPIELPKFDGNKIIEGMEMDFEYEVPKNSYPSCLIDNTTYVRHILIFDFSMVEAKKSTLIIIKNDQYFTAFNELYKAPVEAFIKTGKHKYAIFYMGEMSAVLKLVKNAFTYNEPIKFYLDLDCTGLSIRIQKIYISIILSINKNNKLDHKTPYSKTESIITEKTFSLIEDKKYHLEDAIQMPKNNPSAIYKKLDSDNRKYSQKFKNINLYPSCFNGLVSCQYFLRIMLETNTLFSTNEYASIPIDLFENEKFDDTEGIKDGNNIINPETTVGNNKNKKINSDFNKPIKHSNTMTIKESNKDISQSTKEFNKKDDVLSNSNTFKNNLNSKNNNIINNKNEINNNEEITDGFDAPPSISNSSDKK